MLVLLASVSLCLSIYSYLVGEVIIWGG